VSEALTFATVRLYGTFGAGEFDAGPAKLSNALMS
jgi:hypothetical protein